MTHSREELHASIFEFAAGGYAVDRVIDCVCVCGGDVFIVGYDDDEGTAVRLCIACDTEYELLDSEQRLSAEYGLDAAECTCDGTEFTAAVGFALLESGQVRWVSLGLRCVECALAGVYTDWKIDYEPSEFLLERV